MTSIACAGGGWGAPTRCAPSHATGSSASTETSINPATRSSASSGDIDIDEVHRRVEAEYGGLSDRPVSRWPGPAETGRLELPRYREWSGDIVETQVVLGWRTVPTLHTDTPLLDLAAMVLGAGRGSRLYRGVRERQLASMATASNYTPTELGVFVVHAECPPDRAGRGGPSDLGPARAVAR